MNKDKIMKERKTVVSTTMSKAYQITVPSVVRKALGLRPGDPVDIELEKGRMVIYRAETREERMKRAFMELARIRLEQEQRMTPAQKEFAKVAAGWTASQHREYIDSLPETKMYMKEKYGA